MAISGVRKSGGLIQPQSDVGGLRAFVTVARLGTVGRAAEALGRTQPSISARLADLERQWETRLFRRAPRGMELTPEGTRLLPMAELVLQQLSELDRAAGIPVTPAAELRIGAGDAIGRRRLPKALASMLRKTDDLDVRVREGSGPLLLQALRDGEIDVAFVLEGDGVVDDAFDVEPLLESEVVLLAPRGEIEGHERALPLKALADRRLVVLQSGSRFREHLERAFRQAEVSFHPAVEVGNLSLVRRFVAAGLGVAPVPSVAFSAHEAPGIVRRRLAGVPPLRYVQARRAGVPIPSATRVLVEKIRAV